MKTRNNNQETRYKNYMLGNFNNNLRKWLKVSDLHVGMQIAVPRAQAVVCHGGMMADDRSLEADGGDVMWDEVVEIKKVGEERVWDIEVEGTHNFVAGHLIRPAAEVANAEVEQSQSNPNFVPQWVVLTPEEEKEALEHESMRTREYENMSARGGSALGGKTLIQDKIFFGAIFAHNTYISGNVGIGITSPQAQLHASTTDESTIGVKITLSGTAPTANAFEIQSQAGAFFSGFTAAGGLLMNISSTTALNIQNGSGVQKFWIDSATGNATTTGNLTFSNANPFIQWAPAASGDKFKLQSSTTTLASLDIGGAWTTKGPQNANGSPDIAEYILSDEQLEVGEVVVVKFQIPNSKSQTNPNDPNSNNQIWSSGEPIFGRSTTTESSVIAGVIASGSSFTAAGNLKDKYPDHAYLLALAGRVPVKVTTRGGSAPIAVGDWLTSSEIPGVAQRATTTGVMVGRALTPLAAGDGQVVVLVNVGYADPAKEIPNSKFQIPNNDQNPNDQLLVVDGSIGIGTASTSLEVATSSPESATVTIIEAPTAFENIAIGQNAAVGGRLDVAGDAAVGKSLQVGGEVATHGLNLGSASSSAIGLWNRSDPPSPEGYGGASRSEIEGLLVSGFTQFGVGSLPQATSTILLSPTSIENPQSGDVFVTGRLEVSGMAYFTGGISLPQGDIAEKMMVLEGMVGMGDEGSKFPPEADPPPADKVQSSNLLRRPEAGDVVVIDGTGRAKVRLSWRKDANDIAGVISTDPASILKRGEQGEPVAVAGTVPVKVSDEGGAIRRGDLLTTASLLGHAKKASFADAGTVGVAMEEAMFETSSTTRITVLLAIKNNTVAKSQIPISNFQTNPNDQNPNSEIVVTDNIDTSDILEVSGANEEGALTVVPAVTTYGGNLEVRGAVAVGGALAVRSAVVEETLVVKGDVEIGGSLKVAGSSVIRGNLEIEGALVSTFWEWIPDADQRGLDTRINAEVSGVTTTDMWMPGSEGAATTSAFTLEIGDAVRIAGENAVRKVSAGDQPFESAIGLVVEIEEWANEEGRLARNIKVATAGTIRGWEGLVVGSRYYLGSTTTQESLTAAWEAGSRKQEAGRPLVTLATSIPEQAGYAAQVMGVARSASELILMPSLEYRVVEDKTDRTDKTDKSDKTDSVIVPIMEPVVVPAPMVDEAPVQDNAQDIIELKGVDMTAPPSPEGFGAVQGDRSDTTDIVNTTESATTPLDSAPTVEEAPVE